MTGLNMEFQSWETYTSYTTGQPKRYSVELRTHRPLRYLIARVYEWYWRRINIPVSWPNPGRRWKMTNLSTGVTIKERQPWDIVRDCRRHDLDARSVKHSVMLHDVPFRQYYELVDERYKHLYEQEYREQLGYQFPEPPSQHTNGPRGDGEAPSL